MARPHHNRREISWRPRPSTTVKVSEGQRRLTVEGAFRRGNHVCRHGVMEPLLFGRTAGFQRAVYIIVAQVVHTIIMLGYTVYLLECDVLAAR
jgi:hypothetical protein